MQQYMCHKIKLMGGFRLFPAMVFLIFMEFSIGENSEDRSWESIGNLEKAYNKAEKSPTANLHQKENFTLDGVLKYAYLHSPSVKAAFFKWKASLNRVPMSRSLEDPQFSYVYFLKSVETRVGPQRQRFTLMQGFPWFGVLSLKGSVAFSESEVNRLQFEKQWLELSQSIKKSFAEYYLLGKKIEILEDKFSLLKGLYNTANAQYTRGSAIYKKILMLQVEMGKLENDLESLSLGRKALNDELANIINYSADSLFPFPDTLAMPPETPLEEEALWQKIIKNNPSLKELSQKLNGSRLEEKLAAKSYYPNFKLGVDWVQTDKGEMSVNENGKDPIMLMATVNIPIQFSSKSHGVKMARAKQKAVLHMSGHLELQLRTVLSKILFKIEDAARKKNLYKQSLIPIAEQSLWALQTEFKAGDASFLELIEGERELLKFEFDYQESLRNLVVFWAELEYITGESL